jgi:hypothetical protein
MHISLEHWWNDIDRGKAKFYEKNLSWYHFVHYKFHMDWPGIEPGLLSVRAAANRLSHGMASQRLKLTKYDLCINLNYTEGFSTAP